MYNSSSMSSIKVSCCQLFPFLSFSSGHPFAKCPYVGPLITLQTWTSLGFEWSSGGKARGANRVEVTSAKTVGEAADSGMRRLTGADHELLDQHYGVMQVKRFTGHRRKNSSSWQHLLMNPLLGLPSETLFRRLWPTMIHTVQFFPGPN